jgi:hypothetical protein
MLHYSTKIYFLKGIIDNAIVKNADEEAMKRIVKSLMLKESTSKAIVSESFFHASIINILLLLSVFLSLYKSV